MILTEVIFTLNLLEVYNFPPISKLNRVIYSWDDAFGDHNTILLGTSISIAIVLGIFMINCIFDFFDFCESNSWHISKNALKSDKLFLPLLTLVAIIMLSITIPKYGYQGYHIDKSLQTTAKAIPKYQHFLKNHKHIHNKYLYTYALNKDKEFYHTHKNLIIHPKKVHWYNYL